MQRIVFLVHSLITHNVRRPNLIQSFSCMEIHIAMQNRAKITIIGSRVHDVGYGVVDEACHEHGIVDL